jgi:hypothetical protein
MGTSNGSNLSPDQINIIARNMISAQSVRMTQQIFSQTVVPANQSVINIVPRNVGLIMGFWVKITATVTNTGSVTAITPTNFGAANVLSQVQFTDLNNNVRIQTPGWHMNFLNSIKARMRFGAAFTAASADDSGVVAYGANWTVNSLTASIAASGTGTINQWYYVPLAYSDGDYRGAIYANVVNATMNLQLTVNPAPVVASGDSTTAVYTGNTGTISSLTATVYQDYLDQLPFGKNGPILPIIDLSTSYEVKQTTFTAIVAANDFPMQYSNFRQFLSTFAVYYNGSARAAGTDINYWALQSANYTNLWKIEPALAALKSRQLLQTDFPLGTYYFGSRAKPISTNQYGNMELVLNASTAGAGAYCLIGYEDFAYVNTITQAGSLPAS